MASVHRSSLPIALLIGIAAATGCADSDPHPNETIVASPQGFDRTVAWEPDKPIILPAMTHEQKLEFREEWLAAEWANTLSEWPELGEAPEVDLIRFGDPRTGDELLAECYTEAGYPAVASPQSGVDFPDGVQASPQYGLASYTCYAKYTPDPLMLRDWNPEQLGLLHDYLVEWRNPCLESFGLTTREGPDRVTFINEFFTDGSEARAWAFSDPTVGSDNRDDILAACPSLPREHFYGS